MGGDTPPPALPTPSGYVKYVAVVAFGPEGQLGRRDGGRVRDELVLADDLVHQHPAEQGAVALGAAIVLDRVVCGPCVRLCQRALRSAPPGGV